MSATGYTSELIHLVKRNYTLSKVAYIDNFRNFIRKRLLEGMKKH